MGWGSALLIWGYAFTELVVTDALKVRFYELLDHKDVRFRR
jgi:hypothetical protein